MFDISTYQLFVLASGSILFGLFLLIKGGDWTVDAAVFVARRTGLSPLFIGATIVSFGTSVPELFTSVNANLSGFPGISLGNVLGSNVANILLVLGATAMIMPIAANRGALVKDLSMMLLATGILTYGILTDMLTNLFGLGMFTLLIGFVFYQYMTDSLPLDEDDTEPPLHIETMNSAMLILLAGLVALAVGSEMLVQGAVAAGTAIGVDEAIIGMTVVAFGTSLPELSTCIAAARRRSLGLILGNIIGSNTFNILSIVGLTAMIKPLPVVPILKGFELWATVGVAVVFAVWMLTIGKLTRAVGTVMVVAYVAFVAVQYLFPQILI